jgi:hypothetical protein
MTGISNAGSSSALPRRRSRLPLTHGAEAAERHEAKHQNAVDEIA